jgi:hypothetical protein
MVVRIALSLFRGTRSLLHGSAHGDSARILKGRALVTRLIPGVYSGLRGRGSPSNARRRTSA